MSVNFINLKQGILYLGYTPSHPAPLAPNFKDYFHNPSEEFMEIKF